MKLRALELLPRTFRLGASIQTARETFVEREGIRLRLTLEDGRTAWGETTPLPSFGCESVADAHGVLHAILPKLEGMELPEAVDAVEALIDSLVPAKHPAARYGLELALLDALGQVRGMPVSRLLGAKADARVEVNALVSAREPRALADEAFQAVWSGFKTLKIKLHGLPPELEAERVSAVRARVGAEVKLRIDANGAYAVNDARRLLKALRPFGLELCEQPVPADDIGGFETLDRESLCPLAADESLARPDFARVFPYVDVLVLKPTVLGGLVPCLKLAAQAKGLRSYVTHGMDGAVARIGGLHLAAAMARPDSPASGLALDSAADPDVDASFFVGQHGSVELPASPGLGVGRLG